MEDKVVLLESPPAKEEIKRYIEQVKCRQILGCLWLDGYIVHGFAYAPAFPSLKSGSDWQDRLKKQFDLIHDPSVWIIGLFADFLIAICNVHIEYIAQAFEKWASEN